MNIVKIFFITIITGLLTGPLLVEADNRIVLDNDQPTDVGYTISPGETQDYLLEYRVVKYPFYVKEEDAELTLASIRVIGSAESMVLGYKVGLKVFIDAEKTYELVDYKSRTDLYKEIKATHKVTLSYGTDNILRILVDGVYAGEKRFSGETLSVLVDRNVRRAGDFLPLTPEHSDALILSLGFVAVLLLIIVFVNGAGRRLALTALMLLAILPSAHAQSIEGTAQLPLELPNGTTINVNANYTAYPNGTTVYSIVLPNITKQALEYSVAGNISKISINGETDLIDGLYVLGEDGEPREFYIESINTTTDTATVFVNTTGTTRIYIIPENDTSISTAYHKDIVTVLRIDASNNWTIEKWQGEGSSNPTYDTGVRFTTGTVLTVSVDYSPDPNVGVPYNKYFWLNHTLNGVFDIYLVHSVYLGGTVAYKGFYIYIDSQVPPSSSAVWSRTAGTVGYTTTVLNNMTFNGTGLVFRFYGASGTANYDWYLKELLVRRPATPGNYTGTDALSLTGRLYIGGQSFDVTLNGSQVAISTNYRPVEVQIRPDSAVLSSNTTFKAIVGGREYTATNISLDPATVWQNNTVFLQGTDPANMFYYTVTIPVVRYEIVVDKEDVSLFSYNLTFRPIVSMKGTSSWTPIVIQNYTNTVLKPGVNIFKPNVTVPDTTPHVVYIINRGHNRTVAADVSSFMRRQYGSIDEYIDGSIVIQNEGDVPLENMLLNITIASQNGTIVYSGIVIISNPILVGESSYVKIDPTSGVRVPLPDKPGIYNVTIYAGYARLTGNTVNEFYPLAKLSYTIEKVLKLRVESNQRARFKIVETGDEKQGYAADFYLMPGDYTIRATSIETGTVLTKRVTLTDDESVYIQFPEAEQDHSTATPSLLEQLKAYAQRDETVIYAVAVFLFLLVLLAVIGGGRR